MTDVIQTPYIPLFQHLLVSLQITKMSHPAVSQKQYTVIHI